MTKMKQNRKYYFSVEGETEDWYLRWLQETINATAEAKYKVVLDCSIKKDPLKRAKSLIITGKTEVYHIADYESNEDVHTHQFRTMLERMKMAEKIGKQIKYRLGYSNFTFELWIILHKTDCNQRLTNRRQYLVPLNHAYGESFENLDQYKHEKNFKRVLSKMTLEDVKLAVSRAKAIMKCNEDSGFRLKEYMGYKYYEENPSLMIWEVIEKILADCNLN